MSNNKYQAAFDKFMAEEAENAIIRSTQAGWGGSGYSVELFEDATYRVLWDGEIGNLYQSDGIIIDIPQLADDEWNDEEAALSLFDNALDELRDAFEMEEV